MGLPAICVVEKGMSMFSGSSQDRIFYFFSEMKQATLTASAVAHAADDQNHLQFNIFLFCLKRSCSWRLEQKKKDKKKERKKKAFQTAAQFLQRWKFQGHMTSSHIQK